MGNQAYGSVLVDGFLAAIWRLEAGGAGTPATVTVQELRPFTAAERDDVTDEAVALLSVMTKATAEGGAGDVRFASFVDFGD
nr:crosslink repair DNA glycosylase YcaQ family protein [Streptomyces sp. or43]